MATVGTSTVFDAWEALELLLSETAFTVHPAADGVVQVVFGWPDDYRHSEHVVILAGVESAADQPWRTLGECTKEERYQIPVYVATYVAHPTAADARERLRVLTSEAETAIRAVKVPTTAPGHIVWWGVRSVKPMVIGTEHGWAGLSELLVEVVARF